MSTLGVMNAGSKTMNTNQYSCCFLSYKSTLYSYCDFSRQKNNAFISKTRELQKSKVQMFV